MGPTSRAPLPARASAGKALGKVANPQAIVDPPRRRDGRERMKDESTARERGMRYGQAPGFEAAAAPQHEIEVENTRAPATAASPAELPLK